MKPIRLRARNLRTFPDVDIRFEHGLTGILGELRDAPEGADSNGAGKSTLLEAVDIALFGRRSLAGYLTRGGDVDELMIELTFEHGNRLYRVRRTYSAKGRGKTSLDLEQHILHPDSVGAGDEGGWIPLTRASTRETDDAICDLLGLSRDTFRDSSYLRQGDGGYADPDRDPRQRKALLVEAVLGRDPIWPKLQELAKTRRKQAESVLERRRGEVETLGELAGRATAAEYEAAQAEEQVVTASAAVSEAEARHSEIAARYQAAREQAATRAALEAELREAEQALAVLEQRETAAAEAVLAIEVARDELALLPAGETERLFERKAELERAIEEHRRAVEANERARIELAQADRERADLGNRADALRSEAKKHRWEARELAARPLDEDARCDHCGQVLGVEARDERLRKYEADAADCDTRADGLLGLAAAIKLPLVPPAPDGDPPIAELETVLEQLRVAQAAATQRARLEERIVQLQQTVESRPRLDNIEQLREGIAIKRARLDDLEPVDVAAIEQEGAIARVNLQTAQQQHEIAIAAKARCDERLTQIRMAEQKLSELTGTITGLQEQIDRDLILEKAYGRDGIPALIIENTAIPQIEADASRILQALGTCFQVELRTQTETKTGSLRDTLDVVVIDPDGNEADYADGCSGGEQTRIGLALRIALARLLARRRGAESRLLALDEPSYLDAAGMTALLDVLRGLEDEFDMILLVSHVAELRDALDETITVIRDGGRSRIDGIREPLEAVMPA